MWKYPGTLKAPGVQARQMGAPSPHCCTPSPTRRAARSFITDKCLYGFNKKKRKNEIILEVFSLYFWLMKKVFFNMFGGGGVSWWRNFFFSNRCESGAAVWKRPYWWRKKTHAGRGSCFLLSVPVLVFLLWIRIWIRSGSLQYGSSFLFHLKDRLAKNPVNRELSAAGRVNKYCCSAETMP